MKYNTYKMPFNEVKKNYFDKNREKIGNNINFIEKIPYKLFKNDPTLEWLRTKYFQGMAEFLFYKLKISANMMSLIGLMFAIFAFAFASNLILFCLFIFLNLFSDGLDGVIARISNNANRKGEFIDIICDTLASIIFISAMVKYGYLSVEIGVIFTAMLIPYTIIATNKSILLIDKGQSIGSRIAVGFGSIFLTLLASLNIITVTTYSNYLEFFIIAISILMVFGLLQSFFKYLFLLSYSPENKR